ncbi:MAG: selenium metabolism-associated LysR family transcriptional regulator [Chloroflexota bacterium]|nr:selenium metabolism-associated LysR family transcriptional regulator [Chloroflexota bacterium]
MDTNFHQLNIFDTVAKLASFSKAADALSISQPAVSIQIRKLESDLHTILINRTPSGITLTEEGKMVYDYTKRIFELAEDMEQTMMDMAGLKSGKLSIGSSTTPGEYLLPSIIGRFRSKFPMIEISVEITNTQTIVARIQRREIHLGFAGAPIRNENIESFEYVSDNIVLIASPNHPMSAKTGLCMRDLVNHDFVLRESGSATRDIAEKSLAEHEFPVKVSMELGSNEAVKRAVEAGLGIGLISEFGITSELGSGLIKILDVVDWKCTRPLTVFYRNDLRLSPAQNAFLQFLIQEVEITKEKYRAKNTL